jgi:hypothetical protein
MQNGAASFTVQPHLANSWAGAGAVPPDSDRVVIRARVPKEAVLSLPVFGKNLHSEQEVVVSGLPWKSWDAWYQRAPGFDDFEIKHPRGPDGRFIAKPDWKEVDAKAPGGWSVMQSDSGDPDLVSWNVEGPDGKVWTTKPTKEAATETMKGLAKAVSAGFTLEPVDNYFALKGPGVDLEFTDYNAALQSLLTKGAATEAAKIMPGGYKVAPVAGGWALTGPGITDPTIYPTQDDAYQAWAVLEKKKAA